MSTVKSGFKCRLCPRIVCMTEETLKAHLKSKLTVEMAFYGRLGSLMRQTVSQPSGQVPMASICLTPFVACHLQSFSLEVFLMERMTILSEMHFQALVKLWRPLDERNIRVNYANDRPSAPRTYGCSGSYRGDFGDAKENDGF
ncbi:hypothetical protein RHSIM_Rhsim10G0057600 [Rhododendron simsii]|uniref:Uncharacterized protein n=1 Tax=Rhododendron simsii TaxID=118357 RepID=A0A834GCA9_RHOSS|nr:hypothetical protein RHSIM_Rhsim10G0057600 [Rhododendron simsii]